MLLLNVSLDAPDQALLEKVYHQFRNAMYFEAYSITHNSDDAEDVVQEVFLKIARKHMPTLARLAEGDKLLYYLLSAARNTARNHFEKASVKNEVLTDPDDLGSAVPADESFIEHLSDALDAQELIGYFGRLKPLYRDILYQRFVLELSVREIAEMDHLPAATVRKRLLRGKQLLLKMYEEKSHE